MQEQVWSNAALDKPLMEGVGEAGAEGALVGGVMGAGAGVFGRGRDRRIDSIATDGTDIEPDVAPPTERDILPGVGVPRFDDIGALARQAEIDAQFDPRFLEREELLGRQRSEIERQELEWRDTVARAVAAGPGPERADAVDRLIEMKLIGRGQPQLQIEGPEGVDLFGDDFVTLDMPAVPRIQERGNILLPETTPEQVAPPVKEPSLTQLLKKSELTDEDVGRLQSRLAGMANKSWKTRIENKLAEHETLALPAEEQVKEEPTVGDLTKEESFLKSDNEYLRVETDNGEILQGVPLSELTDEKALNSRLSDLYSDQKGLKDSSIDTASIDEAIKFLEDKLDKTTKKEKPKPPEKKEKILKSEVKEPVPKESKKYGTEIPTEKYEVYALEYPDGLKYAVRENMENSKGFGDSVHATAEEAEQFAEKSRTRDEANIKFRAKQDKVTKEKEKVEQSKKEEREDVDGFADDLTPMQRGKVLKTLNMVKRFDGKEMTVKDKVRELVKDKAELREQQENKIKPMSRRAYNRADNAEQEAHEKRIKEGGTKTVYAIGGYELGRTAYDYAKHLQEKKPPKVTKKPRSGGEIVEDKKAPAKKVSPKQISETKEPWDYLDSTHPDAIYLSWNSQSNTGTFIGGENLSNIQKSEYHKVWIDRINKELKAVRGVEAQDKGIKWANKNAQKLKTQEIKKLIAQRRKHESALKQVKTLIPKAEELKKKPKPGSVFLDKGGRKPFFDFREIKRGKNKGKVEVTLTDGRKVIVEKSAVKSLPSSAKQFQVVAFHGGPHEFDKFSTGAIGTGEGAQAFGWGLYFTDKEGIARDYARTLGLEPTILIDGKPSESIIANKLRGFIGARNIIQYTYRLNQLSNVKELLSTLKTELKSESNRLKLAKKIGQELPEAKRLVDNLTKAIELVDSGRVSIDKKRNLYKVTLHEGKEPSEYEYLRWDTKVPKKIIADIEKQGKKEGVIVGEKSAIEQHDAIVKKYGTFGALLRKVGKGDDTAIKDREAINKLRPQEGIYRATDGNKLYQSLSKIFGSDKEASLFLLRAGIDGIQYPTGTLSGVKDSKDFNYVVFDESAVTIEDLTQFQAKQGSFKPADNVTIDDVKKIFKGQRAILDDADGSIRVITKKGHAISIKTVDQINEDNLEFDIAYGRVKANNEVIAGSYQNGRIELTRDIGDVYTLAHETGHWLEESQILSNNDISVLKTKIIQLANKKGFTPTDPENIGGREDRANFIADNLNTKQKGSLERVFAKIRDWLDRLVNLAGRRTAGGVVRDIKTGKIFDEVGAEPFRSARAIRRFGTKRNTDTQAFKKWFGDSKVVGADGEPLVVYHGSRIDEKTIDVFEGKRGTGWFSEEALTANMYADWRGSVYPTYLKVVNPLDLTTANIDMESVLTKDEVVSIFKKVGVKLSADKLNISGLYSKGISAKLWEYLSPSYTDLQDKIWKQGYDGVKITERGKNTWLVKNPTQIKSIYNRGTFDPLDPHISYSTKPSEEVKWEKRAVGGYAAVYKGQSITLSQYRRGTGKGFSWIPRINTTAPESPAIAYEKLAEAKKVAIDFVDKNYLEQGELPPSIQYATKVLEPEVKEATEKLAKDPTVPELVTEAPSILQRLGKRFGRGYTDKDLKLLRRTVSLPAWVAKTYSSVKALVDQEIKSSETRSKELFSDYNDTALGEIQEALPKNKEAYAQTRDLIWKWDGKRFSKKDVPTNWYKPIVKGEDIQIDPKHYEEIEAYLKKEGTDPEAIEAFVTMRKLLDAKYADIDKTLRVEKLDPTLIEEYRSQIGKVHNYFPHKRIGDSYVQIIDTRTDDPDKRVAYRRHYNSWNRFKNSGEQVKAQAEEWLSDAMKNDEASGKRSDYKINIGKVKNLPDEVFFNVPVESMQQILSVAGTSLSDARVKYEAQRLYNKEGLTEEQALEKARKRLTADMEAALSKAVADVLKSRGFGQHALLRKGIPGHETEDIFGTMFDYLSGYAGFKTKIERARSHHKVLTEIDAKKHPGEYRYASRYVQDVLANQDQVDRTVDGLRAMFFVKYLGFVPKSGIVNLTQNVVMAAPVLSQYLKGKGLFRAERLIGKAMADLHRAVTSKQAWTTKGEVTYPGIPKNEQLALHTFIEEGASQDLYLRELKGNLPETGWTKYFKKVIDKAGIFMQVAEKWNRASTGLAAYRVGTKELKMDHAEAVDFAKSVIYDSHFLYGSANLPEIFRGGDTQKVMRAAYTFRTFTHNYLSSMAHLLKNQGPEGKRAFARGLRNLFLVGGLTSMPFFKAASEMLLWATGDDDEDAITRARAALPQDWMKDMVTYGLPGVAGIDLTGSLGIEVPRGWKDLIGVPYSMIEDTVNTIESLQSGAKYRALSETPFTPLSVRNAMRGIELYTAGQRTRSGKDINYPGDPGAKKISAIEAIGKSVGGFQPTSVSKGYGSYQATQRLRDSLQRKKSKLADRYVNALKSGDEETLKEIKKNVVKWNKEAREEGKPYKIIDIRNSIKYRLRPNIQEIPKNLRRKVLELSNQWR